MKTKNSIKIPRKATHIAIIDAAGKTGKMMVKDFASLSQADIESMGEKVQFIIGTGKRAKVIGEMPIAKSGEVEAIASAICDDASRATGETNLPATVTEISGTKETIADELTNAVATWNSKDIAPIQLREKSNVLARFEYVPQPLIVNVGTIQSKIIRAFE